MINTHSKLFKRLNHRRFELICKEMTAGLSLPENAVLQRLQILVGEIVENECGMDFRGLIRMEYVAKSTMRKLFPRGAKHPSLAKVSA